MQDWKTKLVWLSKDDAANPCPFEVLDCRPAIAGLEATVGHRTGFPFVEKIVDHARKNPTIFMPGDLLTTKCSIDVPMKDPRDIAPLKPTAEHKWELDVVGLRVLARRLWTGQIIHVADFQVEDNNLVFYQLISDKNAVFDSPAFAVAEMQFLLRTYLEKRLDAFPVPPGIALTDLEGIAVQGWKSYGPAAAFARPLSETLPQER